MDSIRSDTSSLYEFQSSADAAGLPAPQRIVQAAPWLAREPDVKEVDVDKLKEMVHVSDADLAEAAKPGAPQ